MGDIAWALERLAEGKRVARLTPVGMRYLEPRPDLAPDLHAAGAAELSTVLVNGEDCRATDWQVIEGQ